MRQRVVIALVVGAILAGGAIGAAYLNEESASDPLKPIAMAWINEDGEAVCGTSNVSGAWDPDGERFVVEIEGEDYYYREYVTLVTATSAVSAGVLSDDGKLVIRLQNRYGESVRASFQFVTYKCPES
jgi:hypothetical protein